MGALSSPGCESWRGVIAMDVFGRADPDERAGLLAHLDGCPECRVLAESLARTHDALAFADPRAAPCAAPVPPELTTTVLGALHTAGRRQRRRRTAAVVTLAAGGLVAASLIVLALLPGTSTAPLPVQRAEALHGARSVTATAVLSEQPWGTSLSFHERGLPGGAYTVSMRTSGGRWWVAGTYRATLGQPIDAVMACAVAMQQITGIRVTDAAGAQVLGTYSATTTSATYPDPASSE
jgi:Putative zinc-finger